MHTYNIEYTDTFGGEANYCWVKRATISVPEWDSFRDWDGNGRREPKGYQACVMKKAKAAVGLTGVKGVTHSVCDGYEFRPWGIHSVLCVTWRDSDATD